MCCVFVVFVVVMLLLFCMCRCWVGFAGVLHKLRLRMEFVYFVWVFTACRRVELFDFVLWMMLLLRICFGVNVKAFNKALLGNRLLMFVGQFHRFFFVLGVSCFALG